VVAATVAVVLVALSLSHLAQGIHLVTKAPLWEAWAMAVGIDLGFLALEIAQLSGGNADGTGRGQEVHDPRHHRDHRALSRDERDGVRGSG
jgi:hypothetical protein